MVWMPHVEIFLGQFSNVLSFSWCMSDRVNQMHLEAYNGRKILVDAVEFLGSTKEEVPHTLPPI